MNRFISDYLEKLRSISSDENLIELYHWFWDKQDEIKHTAEEINRVLGLNGDHAIKPDLPCLTIGSRTGLLFLLVNPGWTEINQKAEDYCRKSKDAYVDLMLTGLLGPPKYWGSESRIRQA